MTRLYTLSSYRRLDALYRKMPAKEVAKKMRCSPSLVRKAKRVLKLLKEKALLERNKT